MSDTSSQKKQLLRKLTPAEKREALKFARKNGLPEDWGVEWDNKREKKIWISPDGSRKCYSLPQALKYALKLGQVLSTMEHISSGNNVNDKSQQKTAEDQQSASLSIHHRKLSPAEVAQKIQEGRKSGLPEGWTVVWDNMSNQRVWISPDGKKKCKGIPGALAYSVKCGWITADKIPKKYSKKQTTNRTLSPEEVQEFLKEAREKGLPDGWNVEWNNVKQKKRWIAPDGCKVHSIPEALRMSLRKGWISQLPDCGSGKTPASASDQADPHTNNLPRTQQPTVNPNPNSRRIQHIPSGNRHLTESEQLASMEEARARGLEGGWKAEFSNHLLRRIWISPQNDDGLKKYASIADALAGVPMPDDFSDRVKKKKMPKETSRKTKSKKTTAHSEHGQSNTAKAIPRKAAKRKRKVNVDETTAASPASDRDDLVAIPRKRRRNEENDQATPLLPHGKNTKPDNVRLGGDEVSSDGEIVEPSHHPESAAKKTSTASAGKEMPVVVERDSDESRHIVVL